MGRLVIENLTREFSGLRSQKIGAVCRLCLTVEHGEFLVIVGPSGCGKTTTLRLIAGLETPEQGAIHLDGVSMAGVAPKDRDVAMVFQHHGLFPHLTVFENMAFGLRLRKVATAEIRERVHAAAEMLEVTGLLERRPTALSGGECQRVALGRALVRRPGIFLLDEPLSNLDAPMRLQLRGAIAALRRRLGATMIYVTHDQSEAMALADRVAVMKDGAIQQIAPPWELYSRPASRFVATFIGSPPMNFCDGTIVQRDGGLHFETGGLAIPLPDTDSQRLTPHLNQPMTLGLRPEHLRLVEPGAAANGAPVIAATVERVEPAGAESFVYVRAAVGAWVARGPAGFGAGKGQAKACTTSGVMAEPGTAIRLQLDAAQAHFFSPATGHAVPGQSPDGRVAGIQPEIK